MKTRKIIAASLAFLVWAGAVKAQEKNLSLNIYGNMSTPVGKFKDYIDQHTFRSWGFDLMYSVRPSIAVGLGIGYQDFYQKYPRALYKLSDGSDISAVVTNSVQTFPILVQGSYQFLPEGKLRPFVQLGVGGNAVTYSQYIGEFSNSKNLFRFMARPQAGVFIPLGRYRENGITASASYNYMPLNFNSTDNLDNWSAGIGLRLALK